MTKKGTLKPRPYARLITMIGDQLIRNEKVALTEIIKNSYDADASWVQIRFNDFVVKGNSIKITKESTIEIEDDGIGMTFDIIKDSWMNPASPYKYLKRRKGDAITRKGRIIQGEKGIGRYAVFRMGSCVELFTRRLEPRSEEIYVKSDLSRYDSEFISIDGELSDDPIYLDSVSYDYEVRSRPRYMWKRQMNVQNRSFKREPHGTLIRISNLKGSWTKNKIQGIYDDCLKMVSPFFKSDFTVDITLNGEIILSSYRQDALNDLLSQAPLKMEGSFTDDGFEFKSDTTEVKMDLSELSGIREIGSTFFDKDGNLLRKPECGPFSFQFYVFDLDRSSDLQSTLTDEDKRIIRSHRIYLYRDGIRVYPYGDPTDDWVGLDIARGTFKAGEYLSNDQVVGYVGISGNENPNLRDKTNREGLMDIGNASDDFRILVMGVLGFLRNEFKRMQLESTVKKRKRKKKKGLFIKDEYVIRDLGLLNSHFTEVNDSKGQKIFKKLETDYHNERKILTQRAEVVEDLAATGMAVDATSHDLMIMMDRATDTLNHLFVLVESDKISKDDFLEQLEKLRGQLGFIEDQLHGIQPLFRSSRRLRSKNNRVLDVMEKVKRYYGVYLEKRNISVEIIEEGSPLVIKIPEAILLQVFINLIDNSVYWLSSISRKKKQIKVLIRGDDSEVIFSDNGPGVSKVDAPYIFESFYSTKGISGRGLGLYIARQLLERYDYDIDLIIKENNKILNGANLYIDFNPDFD